VPPDVLTKDAVYTNMAGRFFRGRADIVEGTRQVKDAFKARVTGRQIVDARELAEGVIVAHVVSRAVIADGPFKGENEGHQLYVIVWDVDAWRVAAYQNTRVRSPL
jgi:uncharacterized protein (TIGR02246 family)